jgi:hypothetical protein
VKLSLSRRRLMTRALQAATAVAVVSPTPRATISPFRERGVAGRVVRLQWLSGRRAWPARPAGTASRVLFLSTDDVTATRPADFDLQHGDVWWRHPSCSHPTEAESVG